MSAKDSNGTKASQGGKIRAIVLWPIALVLALIIFSLLIPLHSRPPARQPVASADTNLISNTSSSPHTTIPIHKSLQVSTPEEEPETARLISLMLNRSASQQLRRQAARSLGKIGTDEAMAALKAALAGDTPPYVKAAIAEGLGASPNPAARDLLHELANGKDETTARAAARGLATRGDSDAVDTLGDLLFNDKTPLSVRSEAALALGDVNLPAAQDELMRAVTQIQDEDVLESVLDGLGRRPFSDTEEFFRNYLNSANISGESKVLAIEAITDAEGDVRPFLKGYVNDPNPEVRAAVKDALDFIEPTPFSTPEASSSNK